MLSHPLTNFETKKYFHKRCTRISRRNFNLVLRTDANWYCQSCVVKNVALENNESPNNDQNQSKNSLTYIIITLDSNRSDFTTVVTLQKHI